MIWIGIWKFSTWSRYACMFLFALSTNLYLRSVCVCKQLHECSNLCLLWSDVV